MSMPPEAARGGWARRLPFFYGWIVVAVGFVTMGIGVNARTSFSLIFPPMLHEFGWKSGETAAIFSVGFLAATLYGPFLGAAMDRFGVRRVLAAGSLVISAGLALATQASQLWQLYLTFGVMVVGGSITVSYIGHSMFLPNWFQRRRGLAIGLAFSGVGVIGIVLFPALQALMEQGGWRPTCWLLAALMLLVVLPLNLLAQRQRPEELGLAADGEGGTDGARRPAPDSIVDAEWAAVDWTLARAMRTARFWWLFAGMGSGLFAWYAIQVHQTRYLLEVGIDHETAALALGLVVFTGIAGQIVLGHLSDRIGREWVWSLAAGGFALAALLLLALRHHPGALLLYGMVAAQGLLGYGISALYAAMPAELFQGRRFATIYGVLSLAASLGAAAGPWVTGVVYDRTGSYDVAFWLCVAVSLFCMLCGWMAAPRKVRLVAGQAARRFRASGNIP
jgi:MFS family permease